MYLKVTPSEGIDWESPGKRFYHVPFTYDGAWARMRLPLCVICGKKPGKTIVAIGGTHGDEYEGPVAIKRLIADLSDDQLSGRLILIPVLNVPAFQVGERESPLDGGNMNRAFPGDATGTITQRVARFITDEVLTRSDIVIDIHAAGKTMEIMRSTSFHQIDDPVLYQEYVRTAFAFGMPFTLIYTSGMGSGLLTEEAEKMGKITIGGEFGYGGSTDMQGVQWAYGGILNVMRLHRLLRGEIVNLLPPEYDKQRLVSNTDINSYITAPTLGIVEPLVPVGHYVKQGDPVVRIHDFDQITKPGYLIFADREGFVANRRFRAQTQQGDVVMVIAEEVPLPF